MKILSVDDLLGASQTALTYDERRVYEEAIVAVVRILAERLADVEVVDLVDVSYQPGFAGLCASFQYSGNGPKESILGEYDEGGEW